MGFLLKTKTLALIAMSGGQVGKKQEHPNDIHDYCD
jgi:hypothetical protein